MIEKEGEMVKIEGMYVEGSEAKEFSRKQSILVC
jgi:hypothetical protein